MGAGPARETGTTAPPARRTSSSRWWTYTPSRRPPGRRTRAAAGLDQVRVSGEELAASLVGWANRALEATAAPDEIPYAWRMYAYRGYLLLQALDRSLLEPRLPAAMFYNLLISGRAPA